MDLTKTAPRSPNDKLAGIVSLKRTIDKSKANDEGHLGEYHFDCPHDKPLFEFLGTNAAEFGAKVRELKTDDAIATWVLQNGLRDKSADEIEEFNVARRRWHPDPGSDSEKYFKETLAKAAPGRTDIETWFDLLDLDEGRPVPVATHA
jgi:Domain of unknown function (DUF5069)